MKAFPSIFEMHGLQHANEGMDLRDYIAIKFAQAIFMKEFEWWSTGKPIDEESKAEFTEMCRDAYAQADIMLQVRSEK